MANAGPNPDHGYTTFDNMGSSLIMALQILTMDFWDNIYNKVTVAIRKLRSLKIVSLKIG